jgi:endogenous inhibitor of DNA gyrase (YacG/DUF329 family)
MALPKLACPHCQAPIKASKELETRASYHTEPFGVTISCPKCKKNIGANFDPDGTWALRKEGTPNENQ